MTVEVRNRNRRAIRLGLAAGLVTTALLAFIGSISVIWGMAVGYFAYFKASRSDGVLVWLRRFHRSEPGRIRLKTILQRACAGLCVPITLQDSSFNSSYFAGGSGIVLLWPILGGAFNLLLLPSALAYLALSASGVAALAPLAGGIVALAGLAIWVLAIKRLLTLRGYRTLSGKDATARLNRQLSAIRRRKGLAAGVLVLKCEDEIWREVVRDALRGADAALIDVSEPSTHLLWELRQASQVLSVESIILACKRSTAQAEQLPAPIEGQVREAVGDEIAARLPVFYYPAQQPPVGPERGRAYTAAARALRSALARSLVGTRPPGDTMPPALWRDYLILLVSLTSAAFITVSFLFGPYDLKNAFEAVTGSAVLSFLASLPVLGWMFWRRRKVATVRRS